MRILILISLVSFTYSCKHKSSETLFHVIPPDKSNIHFSNDLKPDYNLNILDYNYFYNGGGVAAADFNNDGLTDLFFSGNMVASKLYLNKADFSFDDITGVSGIATTNWVTGIAVADINNDGLQDMYLSCAGYKDPLKRVHQLYINTGIDKAGIPHFKDEAAAYGLADTSYTTQSAFFDYDKDGDLDLLLVNHYQDLTNPNHPREKVSNGTSSSNAKLYRNDGGHFTDVTKISGLLDQGYGLSVCISDINNDGWPDFYMTKDFVYDDVLYINNQDGTFKESIDQYLVHTSQFSMGSDIADFNNDSYPDIITVDMLPDDNKRQKLMNIAMNNDRFNYILQLGYMPQYSRNMLQLNNGPDATGNYSFSEIGQLAGIYKTDWSWSPLFADLDNDGWKDVYITNGIPHDITNNDFVTYRAEKIINTANTDISVLKQQMLAEIGNLEPVNKPNYVFQNTKNLQFTDQSENWGLAQKGFSNGAVYVDLDNDGDLDIVTNNINAPASVFKNNATEQNGNNFLRVKLNGGNNVGTKIMLSSNGHKQYIEHSVIRGFQSSQDPIVHFGLGKDSVADTLRISWPDNTEQVLLNIKAGQLVIVDKKNAIKKSEPPLISTNSLFTNNTQSGPVDFTHRQNEFEEFNFEPLLPHRFSRNGPYMAKGDIDNNGLEDFWIGGPAKIPGTIFLQQSNGTFLQRNMPDPGYEDMDGILFDADGDKDLDLFVVSGGNVYNANTATYQDRLYINQGDGNFKLDSDALPVAYSSGSTVVANDFDKDGDVDIFVGGRVVPGTYGVTPESFLLRNNGKGKFENATQQLCPGLENIGMITTALWSDFDNDGWTDLIVAGEWMPVTFFKNTKGNFKKVGGNPEMEAAAGWWFSLAAGDFDKDGDIDYIAGNIGLNNKLNVTQITPLSAYIKDFDGNGTLEPILSYYLNGKEYTIANRDQISSVMPSIKKKFDIYTKFAEASFSDIFSAQQLQDALILKATNFSSMYIDNKGNGKFVIRQLPLKAQFSAIQSMQVDDYNADGNLDVLIAGNFYSPDFMTGRYDASIGLVLMGDGRGGFKSLTAAESGIYIKGDARALCSIIVKNKKVVLAAVNQGRLQVFTANR